MRIVLLTTRLWSPQIPLLVDALASAGAEVVEIVCARSPRESRFQHWAANSRNVRRLRGGGSGTSDVESRSAGAGIGLRAPTMRFFAQLFHAPRVVEHLGRIRPDLLVHVNGPIFRRQTLETARLGLLNCHMGLLPEFRGMNAAEWSVIHGYPVGNTVHFIDSGIDTGRILAFFEVDVSDEVTVQGMRKRLISLQAAHTAEVVRLLCQDRLAPIAQLDTDGKQYFRMHPTLRAGVERLLAGGYTPHIGVDDRPYHFAPVEPRTSAARPEFIKA